MMFLNEKQILKRYATVIGLWRARLDTCEIAKRTGVPEHVVAKWIANFRDLARAA